MKEYNLNDFKKVKYICLIYKNKRFYFRQEYLLDDIRWGELRPISEKTFLQRKNDGFPVEYRHIDTLPECIIRRVQEIDALIDLALDTRDEEWFYELIKKRMEYM